MHLFAFFKRENKASLVKTRAPNPIDYTLVPNYFGIYTILGSLLYNVTSHKG